jgi:CRISPR system Cascade subunit CasA
MAIFTLQVNAPSGGAGHRTSLRGGGPLTTLAEPNAMDSNQNTLWHRTWLNILIKDDLKGTLCNTDLKEDKYIFPWITSIKVSKEKGSETTGNDIHPLQTYWATPRRIYLEDAIDEEGTCDICGDTVSSFYTQYHTRPHGINYSEGIIHPLSPYYKDNNGNMLPVHPQPGGFTYRHWPAYVTSINPDRPRSLNIRVLDDRLHDLGISDVEQHVMVFGYDMDNMKARCWYETRMPYWLLPETIREDLVEKARLAADTARQIASNTRSSVKEAWFDPKRTVRGDISFVEMEFWSSTEKEFYRKVREIQALLEKDENPSSVLEEWLRYLNMISLHLFDFYSEQIGLDAVDGNGVPRLISARSKLIAFNTGKKTRKILQLPETIKA